MSSLPSNKYANPQRTVSGTVTVEDSDVILNCDTSSAPVTIDLKEIPNDKWNTNYKLYIKDNSGNASINNITITAPTGFKINNQQSITISADNGCALCRISSNVDYVAELSYGIVGQNAIPVKNTAYVMKNGSDTTGLVERFDKPFLTIQAATTALAAAYPTRDNLLRYRVVVEDGYYEEDIILQKYIDYDLGNCVINGEVTDNNVDFGASGSNVWTNIIYGACTIYNQKTSGNIAALATFKPNTKLLMYADTLSTKNDDCIVILNGIVKLVCNNIFSESTGAAFKIPIEMAQGFLASDFTYSKLEIWGANIYNMAGSGASVIAFTAGGASKNQEVQLINCRIKAQNTAIAENCSAIACGVVIPSNGKISLYNTVLYSANGNSLNVVAGNTLVAYGYNSNMSNQATGGGGTLTYNLNAITVDAAVEAGF